MFRELTKEETTNIISGKLKPAYKVVKLINDELCTDRGVNCSRFKVGMVTISPSKQGLGTMLSLESAKKYITGRKPFLEHAGLALIKILPLKSGTLIGNYTEVYTVEILDAIPEKKDKDIVLSRLIVPTTKFKTITDVTDECYFIPTKYPNTFDHYALTIYHKNAKIGEIFSGIINITNTNYKLSKFKSYFEIFKISDNPEKEIIHCV